MENKVQVDSSQKSPVSKTVPPAEKDQTPATGGENCQLPTIDKNVESKGKPSTAYQSTSANNPEVVNESDKSKETESATGVSKGAESPTPPIISVDIKKSMPYETSSAVPQNSKSSDVSPEVVASVVTSAVVNEAAFTVSSTEGNVINGSKARSDSSKVDSVVEQELSKFNSATDPKTLETPISTETTSFPNGDIDHSPVTDDNLNLGPRKLHETSTKLNAESITETKTPTCEEVSEQNLNGVQSNNNGAINGVPGVITVVAISKKDPSCNSNTAKEMDGFSTDSKKSNDLRECKDVDKDKEKTNVLKEYKSNMVCDDADARNIGTDSRNSEHIAGSSAQINEDVAKTTKLSDRGNLTDSAKLQSSVQCIESKIVTKVGEVSASDASSAEDTKGIKEIDSTANLSSELEDQTQCVKSTKQDQGSKVDLSKEKSDDLITKESSKEEANGNLKIAAADKISAVTNIDSEKVSTKQVSESCDSSSMATSKIITDELLKQIETPENQIIEKSEKSSSMSKQEETVVEIIHKPESCSTSASIRSAETRDVGVGLDVRLPLRVASGGGEEEEVDGQEATTEVEMGDDQADEGDHPTPIGTSTPSPTAGSPKSTPSKDSVSGSEPPSGTESKQIETSVTSAEAKPTSADSRSSIPDAIVYEPPERRKSAVSSVEDKKDAEADKSQRDEQETEKTQSAEDGDDIEDKEISKESGLNLEEKTADDEVASDVALEVESSVKESRTEDPEHLDSSQKDTPPIEETMSTESASNDDAVLMELQPENIKEATEDTTSEANAGDATSDNKTEVSVNEEENTVDVDSNIKESLKSEDETTENKENGQAEEKEKGEIDENEKEESESKCVKKEDNEKETSEETEVNAADDELIKDKDTEKKETECFVESSETADTGEAADLAVSQSSEPPQSESTEISKEQEETNDKDELDKKDANETEENNEGKESVEETTIQALKEPSTLVEEQSQLGEEAEDESKAEQEVFEKEVEKKEDEKDEDEKRDDVEKRETEAGEETGNEKEITAIEETEVQKDDEKAEETEQKGEELEIQKEADNEAKADNQEQEEKIEDQAEKEKEEINEDENENVRENEDKQEDKKEAEEDDKAEPSPKSPTKRVRSPDKLGRRGVSPASSPPKPLKTPPSPQKPQKTTSPKKKNGMLSPIKTPKTPGSDTRKLPPIKAPVGLAPNPNLKNIRSKIGSFDNIRYKPGGGDKKVITKKLEWKAAPKIGSLDHSFKEKKHSKSHSKLDPKEEKNVDGQPSGDEADQETAIASDSLLNQSGPSSSENPAAIAVEN